MDRLIEQFVSTPDAPPVQVEPPPDPMRRAIPRQPVDWVARYRLQDDATGYWRACRIADISTAGAGLRLFGVTREEVEGRTIDLSVPLGGEVRNTVEGADNDLRVGIEFVDLIGDSVNYVESLKRSDRRW